MGLTHTVLIILPSPDLTCTDNLLPTTLLSEWRLLSLLKLNPLASPALGCHVIPFVL